MHASVTTLPSVMPDCITTMAAAISASVGPRWSCGSAITAANSAKPVAHSACAPANDTRPPIACASCPPYSDIVSRTPASTSITRPARSMRLVWLQTIHGSRTGESIVIAVTAKRSA